MSSGVQTGNGTSHDKYNIRGIAHPRTNRKDDIFMQRRLVQSFTYILEWGQGTCTMTKHTRRQTYFALRHFLFKQTKENKYEVLIRCVLQYMKSRHMRVCFVCQVCEITNFYKPFFTLFYFSQVFVHLIKIKYLNSFDSKQVFK